MASDQERVLGKNIYKEIWDKSHDVSESLSTLGEHYVDVPDALKDIRISTMPVVQIYEEDLKHLDRIESWHNDEPYINSKNFIQNN